MEFRLVAHVVACPDNRVRTDTRWSLISSLHLTQNRIICKTAVDLCDQAQVPPRRNKDTFLLTVSTLHKPLSARCRDILLCGEKLTELDLLVVLGGRSANHQLHDLHDDGDVQIWIWWY